MSSMRNALQRRNHKERAQPLERQKRGLLEKHEDYSKRAADHNLKERAQPLERQKWGLLEKHKDYSKRVADHNLKKRKIKALQTKASQRNEDEFYFGMLSSSTVKGVKQTARRLGNGATGVLSRDTIALMKTQDVGYLRTMLQQIRMERQRLEKEVIVAETGVHTGLFNRAKVVFNEEGRAVPTANFKRKVAQEENNIENDLANLDGFSEEHDSSMAENALSSEETRKRHAKEVKRRKLRHSAIEKNNFRSR